MIDDYIEDAEKRQTVADPEKVLTDVQLEDGGLRQVRAFVRTTASKNALRVAKSKESKAEKGISQVNVLAPKEVHAALKEIAKLTAAGESLGSAISKAVPVLSTSSPTKEKNPVFTDVEAKVVRALKVPGLRSWLICKLAGV
jgi:chorismate synthase